MAVYARDNSVYASLDQVLTFGQHKGVAIGLVIDEFPDYIRWLIEHDAIVLAGECEEAYGLALIKLENKERDGAEYTSDYDPFADTWDNPDNDDSIANYLDNSRD